MSKHIIYINGTAIEVSEEIYTYIKRSDWNNKYAEIKRKLEKIAIDCETQTVKITPSKEDSLDRLMALGFDFADQSADFRESVTEKIMLEKALEKLSDEERYLITQLFYFGRTARDLATELQVSRHTINNRKRKILLRLRKLIEK